jgi:hypothetical protein
MSTVNHESSIWQLILVAALTGVLYGCARSTSSYGVKPGDVDFPRENPSPTHKFRFEAVLPPKISVHFKLVYTPSVPKVHDCTRVPSSYRPKHPNLGIAPIVCSTTNPTDIVATAEKLAGQRPSNLDAGYLGEDVADIGRLDSSVSFVFWDRDNPLPRGVVNVTLKSSPPPATLLPSVHEGPQSGRKEFH